MRQIDATIPRHNIRSCAERSLGAEQRQFALIDTNDNIQQLVVQCVHTHTHERARTHARPFVDWHERRRTAVCCRADTSVRPSGRRDHRRRLAINGAGSLSRRWTSGSGETNLRPTGRWRRPARWRPAGRCSCWSRSCCWWQASGAPAGRTGSGCGACCTTPRPSRRRASGWSPEQHTQTSTSYVKLTAHPQLGWHKVWRLTSETYLDGWMDVIGWDALFELI